MKKSAFCAMILLLFLGLTACSGKEKSIDIKDITESTFLARVNGELQVATMEEFDKSYYNLDELRDYIDKEVTSYNKEIGVDKITLDNVDVINGKAIMLLTYAGMEQYAGFNEVTAAYFTGGVKDIPIKLPTTLVNAENEALASTEEIIQDSKYKILILTEPYHIVVEGNVKYYSENATYLDENEVQSASDGMTIVVYKP